MTDKSPMKGRAGPPHRPLTRADIIAARETGSILKHAQTLCDFAVSNPVDVREFTPPDPPEQGIYNDDWKKYTLEVLLCTGTYSAAASLVGFRRETIFAWAEEDPEFKRALQHVRNVAQALRKLRTRSELERRGIEGFNHKPVFDKNGDPVIDPATGEQVYTAQYSDAALMKLADMDFPELKDRGPVVEVNASGVIRVPEKSEDAEDFDKKYGDLESPTIEDADFEVKE